MKCHYCGRPPIKKSKSYLRYKVALQRILVATNTHLGIKKTRLSIVTGLSRPTVYKLINGYKQEWELD